MPPNIEFVADDWWKLGESTGHFMQEVGYRFAVAVVFGLFAWAYARVRKLARDWPEIAARRAASKEKKTRDKYNRLVLSAVRREPQLMARLTTLTAIPVAAFVLLLYLLGVKEQFNRDLSRREVARTKLTTLVDGQGDNAAKSKGTDELLATLISLDWQWGVAAWAIRATISVAAGFTVYAMLRLREWAIAAYMSLWLQRYSERMLAIATKEEGRQLSILELKVNDNPSLQEYLKYLSDLSVKHDFPLIWALRPVS